MEEKQIQGQIPYPPPNVFKSQRKPDDVLEITRQNSRLDPLPVIEKIEVTPNGFRVYHKGSKFPTKGWPTPHSTAAIYVPKKILIGWINFLGTKDLILPLLGFVVLPKRLKIRIVERFIRMFSNTASFTMGDYFFEDSYYMEFTRAVMKFISTFLMALGIKEGPAKELAEIFGMFVEHDTAYRYRAEDIFSETTRERLLNDPAGEIQRLVGLLVQRDGSSHAAGNFKSIGAFLRIILWVPYIKRAFKTALYAIEFKDLQLDEADRYHVCNLAGYDFFGEKIEDRIVKYPKERIEGYIVN